MKVVITGGAGFIGSHLAESYAKDGVDVYVLDNLSRTGNVYHLQHLQKYKNIFFEHVDIRTDVEKLCRIFNGSTAVFHLAGQVAVTTSVISPKEDFDINALGTFNVLEAARLQVNKPIVLFSSTNKVYGGIENLDIVEGETRYSYATVSGINEDFQLDFHSPYGCSKGSADQYVRDYARIYDLQTVVLRQSCIYGTRQFGIEDQGWVAWFALATLLNKKATVYGDGKQVRDLLYVDDLVSAYKIAVDNISKANGNVYNIGGGHENTLSVIELIKLLSNLINRNLDFNFSDWRPGDQKIFVSDNSKILNDLGWAPTTNPESGIKHLIEWATKNESLIRSILKK